MSLEVKLQVFEGPLDLLLHLIDKNQIDIYDIPIATITEQYMAYINAMQRDDMEVTSEFLVMAATLIDIKCKMLLPKEVNEEGEEEDPRAELVEKLLEYKMYKYMAYELKDRQMDANLQWFRSRNIPKEVREYEAPVDLTGLIGGATLSKLNEIFQDLLKRQEDKVDPIRSKFGNIEKEEVDMDAKTLYIREYIREHSHFSFRQLLEKQHNKTEIIVTFLVVLEEMKLGEIEISQESTFGDIMITSRKAS
ncbi:segregation and condensation protein A [Butyrivibrio sp. YAB3001]|uniref:segregation and condensation protein A n=1 Tax=Butyrivibrio sp. YAB3001 TaxID=1520812 RepID=UPI0008F651E1|nr:segregation/condensation protein A [Butyrivibrio sp. YAB3001]SFB69126.1 condensin subunit ScpA [Butyrivibrio sp. YAB3001]